VDFDDTVFDFHNKGYQYPQVISLVKECFDLGFYICIFTGSPPEKYDSITNYMENLGIKISSINKNPFPMPFGNNGKIYYNILLDDRTGLAQSYEILRNVVDKIKKV
jgi:hydroxymethylpyrimidine pyrophosphatase-like HAD family hydrolase